MNVERDDDDLVSRHWRDCVDCEGNASSFDRLRTLMSVAPEVDADRLSARVRVQLVPLLASQRARTWRRSVTAVLVLAVVPLPFVLAWGTILGHWLYALASAFLPPPLVGYALGTYGAGVVLLIGLTYAAIPLLLAGRVPAGELESEWIRQ